jgi:hypothetical protein
MLLNGGLMVILMAWRPQGIMGKSAAVKAVSKNFLRQLRPFGRGRQQVESESDTPSAQLE